MIILTELNPTQFNILCGKNDSFIDDICHLCTFSHYDIINNNEIKVKNKAEAHMLQHVIYELSNKIKENNKVNISMVKDLIAKYKQSNTVKGKQNMVSKIITRPSSIEPKTESQRLYLEAIDNSKIIFAEGNAGTGKSFLCAFKAVEHLDKGLIEKIILIRPAKVAQGEDIGFIPGGIDSKIMPFLSPILEALEELLGKERMKSLVSKDIIQIKAAAYLRGSTFKNSFVIVDEAQNLTFDTMKMVLTRIGENSKMVLTGDVTQSDLKSKEVSGIISAYNILQEVEHVSFCTFDKSDVVRSEMCKLIEEAYDKYAEENN